MQRPKTKVLMVAAVLCVLAIVVGTSAYGYFFSGITVQNNKVKTAVIDLTVNDDGVVIPIDLNNGVNDIVPGDSGTVGNYKVKNTGSIAGTLLVGVTPNGEWNTDLGDNLSVVFWLDKTNNSIWDDGDCYFVPDGRYIGYGVGEGPAIPGTAFKPMNDWSMSLSNTLFMDVGDEGYLKMSYLLPPEVISTPERPIMGVSCNFDLLIQLDQQHYENHYISGALSGHTDVTISLYNGGVLTTQKTFASGSSYSIGAPCNPGVYTLVASYVDPATLEVHSWTCPVALDITITDYPNVALPSSF